VPPERIPIRYLPEFRHTDKIGTYADGQFFGTVVASAVRRSFWEQRIWNAVLHYFDHDGAYVRTDLWSAGMQGRSDRKGIELATRKLERWLAELTAIKYGDITIRLFRAEMDGILFGLIDESDEDGEHVELYPNGLGFYPPWDGYYDT
jgi:formate hydrogenlyase regulatory protein HycA